MSVRRSFLQSHGSWLLPAVGGGLFALRASLEAHTPHALWGGLGGAACLLLIYLLRTASIRWTLLNLAWIYVLWPVASPQISLGVGIVAIAGLLIHNLEGRVPPAAVDGLLFVAALCLYCATLAPTMLPADSGEFQITGPALGVAHPPGYALFTMLGKLFSLLPFGEVAWRVNLLGAVTGACTVAIVGRTARRLTGSIWASTVAAWALMFSTTFWAQSTTINIRALIVFFTALSFDCMVHFLQSPAGSVAGQKALTRLALSFGLLVAHHYPQAAFGPVFAILVLWHDPVLLRRVRTWPRYLGAFLLPFLGNLYVVARAISGAPFGTKQLTSAARVVDHLLAKGFSGDMWAFLRLDRVLWERTLVVGNILHFQFGPVLLVLSLVGFAWLVWHQKKQAFLLGGVFAIMAFIVATYRAPQSVEYLMPAYVPVVLSIGCTVALVTEAAKNRVARSAMLALILLPAIILGLARLPSYRTLHHDRSTRNYAEGVLLDAPENARILANWHWYTPLRYLQIVEGQRTDVEVTYLYPQGATEMPQAWPERMVSMLAESLRPLIVTNFYDTYRDLPYRFEPQGDAFLVRQGPVYEVPRDLTRLDVDMTGEQDRIRILGYRLDVPEEMRPGDWLTLDLAWQPMEPLERGYAFTVQLVGPSGVVGQQDIRHDAAAGYAEGEVLVDRYRFPLSLTASPGPYRLIAAIYYPVPEGGWVRLLAPHGADAVSLHDLSVHPATAPQVTLHPCYRSFRSGPTLVGVDYDDTVPEQRRVYTHWKTRSRRVQAVLLVQDQPAVTAEIPPSQEGGYVTVVLDLPAGSTGLTLKLEGDEGTGTSLPVRGPWGLPRHKPVFLPSPRQQQHYVPLSKMTLVGVRAGTSWQPGETARVALLFLAQQPIVLDYVVSVNVPGGQITSGPSDAVPALGAIPTFKWIRGSSIWDVHLVDVPAEAGGSGPLTVTVYDAFTAQTLPILDERFAHLGQPGIPLQVIHVD